MMQLSVSLGPRIKISGSCLMLKPARLIPPGAGEHPNLRDDRRLEANREAATFLLPPALLHAIAGRAARIGRTDS